MLYCSSLFFSFRFTLWHVIFSLHFLHVHLHFLLLLFLSSLLFHLHFSIFSIPSLLLLQFYSVRRYMSGCYISVCNKLLLNTFIPIGIIFSSQVSEIKNEEKKRRILLREPSLCVSVYVTTKMRTE